VGSSNAFISIIYAVTPLHLPDGYGTLDPMTRFESQLGVARTLPGVAASVLVPVGQLPRLLSIIIRVAVPGPA
jgi:hypothetical protein